MMNLFGIPTNRIVAFAGPPLSLVSGFVAAWLVAKVNLLGLPGLDQANVATWLTGGGTLALGAGLTWLGHQKWLTGHHIELRGAYLTQLAQILSPHLADAGPEIQKLLIDTLQTELPKLLETSQPGQLAAPPPLTRNAGSMAAGSLTVTSPEPVPPTSAAPPAAAPPPPDEDDSVHAATEGEPGGASAPTIPDEV